MKILKRVSLVTIVAAIALAFLFGRSAEACRQIEAAGIAANQGCINQGADCRVFGTVICWSQRHMSWKSGHEPHFVVLGNPQRTSLGLAWPPYVVFNSPDRIGGWHMFRVGFRYDRTWKGYIFPTVAAKHLGQPLRY